MLRVTIELLPHGSEERREVIGQATITNTGQGTPVHGEYEVILYRRGMARRVWRRGRVSRFPRLRLGPWDLLCRALQAIVGGRNDVSGVRRLTDSPPHWFGDTIKSVASQPKVSSNEASDQCQEEICQCNEPPNRKTK